MEKIDVYEKYHSEIVKAWKMVEKEIEKEPKFKGICENGAFAQDTLYKKGLLFLGIGASCRDGYKDTCNVEHKPVQYETYKGRIGEDDKEGYPYYKPMIKLAEETGFDNNWSNIDITLFRVKSQENLEPLFKKFPKIMEEQLKLAIKMIIDTDPKIIIVSNALVRDVLKNELEKSSIISSGFDFHFNDDYGTDIIDTPKELKGRPIFFTSMLSGQRALDKGSFERLKWHIKYVQKRL